MFYAFVVLNKTHVFTSLTLKVRLFCQMLIMLQIHNADLSHCTLRKQHDINENNTLSKVTIPSSDPLSDFAYLIPRL